MQLGKVSLLMCELMRMLCSIKKTCLIIDDLHWMDDDSWVVLKVQWATTG